MNWNSSVQLGSDQACVSKYGGYVGKSRILNSKVICLEFKVDMYDENYVSNQSSLYSCY